MTPAAETSSLQNPYRQDWAHEDTAGLCMYVYLRTGKDWIHKDRTELQYVHEDKAGLVYMRQGGTYVHEDRGQDWET